MAGRVHAGDGFVLDDKRPTRCRSEFMVPFQSITNTLSSPWDRGNTSDLLGRV